MNRIVYISLFFPLLSGCVGPIKYLPPTDGPIAQVVFEEIDKRSFVAFTYDEAEFCSARKIIKKTYTPGGSPIAIRANNDISISLAWDTGFSLDPLGGSYEGCNPVVTFKPREGWTYIVSPSDKGIKVCEVDVFAVNGDTRSKIYTQPKISVGGFDENSSFCRPLF